MRDKRIDYAAFAEVWNAGQSAQEVALMLGISLAAVYSRLKAARANGHACITRRGRSLVPDEFADQYNAASSDQELAATLGISLLLVRQRAWLLRNAGYELKRRRVTNNTDYAYMAALLDEKSSIDNHGSQGQRLRLSVKNQRVADFVLSAFPGGSVENNNGTYRITWQRADVIDKILSVTKKYRRI